MSELLGGWARLPLRLAPATETLTGLPQIRDAAGFYVADGGSYDCSAKVLDAIVQAVNQHAALTAVAEAARDVAKEPCARALVILETALATLDRDNSSVASPAPKASE